MTYKLSYEYSNKFADFTTRIATINAEHSDVHNIVYLFFIMFFDLITLLVNLTFQYPISLSTLSIFNQITIYNTRYHNIDFNCVDNNLSLMISDITQISTDKIIFLFGFELCNAMCEIYSIHHCVIKFVSDLQQVCDFLRLFQFPPPINLTATV
jgi:hypothetical protein